jgi:hypothetical protein
MPVFLSPLSDAKVKKRLSVLKNLVRPLKEGTFLVWHLINMMTAFGISDIGDQGRSYARDKTSWSLDGGLFSCMPQTLKGKFRWRQHSVVRESGRSHR